MKKKETFATSGTRIQLRLFAGDQLKGHDMDTKDWMEDASANGTNMGGVLPNNSKNPTFLVWATKDPDGAHLDRIQMIKTWIDADGQTHERIFDIAWEEGRKKNEDGTLAPVGNTVNVPDASYTNTIGSVELKALWQDPEFNAEQSAQYFMRVLEIPTPRWSTYDAKALGIEIPDNLDATIQERAWSSPIWYYSE